MANLKPVSAPVPRKRFTEDNITSGKIVKPRRVFAYGGEKVGKSTFASGAPDAVFICPESGTSHLNIHRLPSPETWDDLLELVQVPTFPKYKTLVIDPVNWLEDLCFARVVNAPDYRVTASTRDDIEKYGGGYMKGYVAAISHWRNLVSVLEKRWQEGMHVILLAHSDKKAFNDPAAKTSYDRYEPAMHHKAAGLLKQWVDDVLFLRHEVIKKVEGSKSTAVGTGEHVIHTSWTTAFDAGNRASLPDELPMSWDAYWSAVQKGLTQTTTLKDDIDEVLGAIDDKATFLKARQMVADAKDNVGRLTEIHAALVTKLNALNASKKEETT